MKTLIAALLIAFTSTLAFATSPGGNYNCTSDLQSLCEGSDNDSPAPSADPAPDPSPDPAPDPEPDDDDVGSTSNFD